MRLSWIFTFAHAGALSISVAMLPTVAATDQAGPDEAVDSFNKAMLSIFHRGQDRLTAKTRPVMVIARDVTVIAEDGNATYPRDAPQYANLKSTSHVILAIIGAVTPWPEDDEAKARSMTDLKSVSDEIDTFLSVIDSVDMPADLLADQRKMLQMAKEFAENALEEGLVNRDSVSDVINKMRPIWAQNMREAARAELEALHKAVSAARASMDEESWDRVYIVHHGGMNVKSVNVVQLYLERVMPEKLAAGQLLFAENKHGIDAMAEEAGYTRMQRIVGAWAFGDPARMEVDLLGYEAGSVLDEMIPAPPPDLAVLE